MLNFSTIQIGRKYGRPWLANEWGFRGYEAISRGVFCPRGGGQIVLFVTRIKQDSLEQYMTISAANTCFGKERRDTEMIRE